MNKHIKRKKARKMYDLKCGREVVRRNGHYSLKRYFEFLEYLHRNREEFEKSRG